MEYEDSHRLHRLMQNDEFIVSSQKIYDMKIILPNWKSPSSYFILRLNFSSLDLFVSNSGTYKKLGSKVYPTH